MLLTPAPWHALALLPPSGRLAVRALFLLLLGAALLISGCAGSGAPSPPPPVRPPSGGPSDPAYHLRTERFLTGQPRVLEQVGAHHAYARGLTGRGVRIGIEDTVVDYTQHAEFSGRVRTRADDGAVLAYAHPFGDHRVSAASRCEARPGCVVHRVHSDGDLDAPDAAVRALVGRAGWPVLDDTLFVLDDFYPSDGPGRLHRWWEVPSPYDHPRPVGGPHHGAHGTSVASVAAGRRVGVAPGATLIPVALNLVGDHAEGALSDVHVHAFIEDLDPVARAALDASAAADLSARYARFDIINQSYGHPFSASLRADGRERAWLKRYLPAMWRAFLQAERPASERAVLVRAAGNRAQDAPESEASWPVHEPALRGHVLAVAATDPSTRAIAAYSSRCGTLPSDWDVAAHGPHYCLVAPGTVRGLVPHADSPGAGALVPGLVGTSYAAPVVSGALALLMEHFRGTRGRTAIVRRMLETADRSGVYADTSVYGAGHLDLEAALFPVGALAAGRSRAPLARTALALPGAFGDVATRLPGAELASFDAQGFPFWVPLSRLVRTHAAVPSPIPPPAPPAHHAPLSPLRGVLGAHWFALSEPSGPGSVWRFGLAEGVSALSHRRGAWEQGFSLERGRYLSGAASGAFGSGLHAGLVWVSRSFSRALGSGLRVDARAMLAAGLPRYDAGAVFSATPSAFSAYSLRFGGARTALTLEQPLRAESGSAVLRLENGRLEGTRRLVSRHVVALRPPARALRATLRHDRAFARGTLSLSLAGVLDAGHVPGRRDASLGVAWRLSW